MSLTPEEEAAWEEYRKVMIPLRKATDQDIAILRGAYEEARMKRWAEYEAAIKPAWEKFQKARTERHFSG